MWVNLVIFLPLLEETPISQLPRQFYESLPQINVFPAQTLLKPLVIPERPRPHFSMNLLFADTYIWLCPGLAQSLINIIRPMC